jgi:hypothetical protein
MAGVRPARVTDPQPALAGDELAIARSVLYASLFQYPLTLAQLRQTLIESAQTPSQILATYGASQALQASVEYRDSFFFPRGRYDLIQTRRQREARSRRFLARHRPLLALISAMPYVRMVALSGSIAHLNLEGDGDLDLFIVTRGRHVWSVTVGVVLLAKLMRRRRSVCANFVVADSRLALEPQDLFTASQIVHLKPLVGPDVLRQLVAANPFVGRFYPNFRATDPSPFLIRHASLVSGLKVAVERLGALPSLAVESLCRRAYSAYLRRRSSTWRSPEHVRLQDDCVKLHTRSHRQSVIERFDRAVHEALHT